MNISNIIDSVGTWVKNFINKILPSSKKFLELASTIVNFIKTTDANNPELLDALVAIIPGTWDDYLLQKLRAHLPTIVTKMKLVTDEADKTPDAIFADAVKLIQSMEKEYAATTLGALWIHISNVLTDNGVSLKDLQKIQQAWYDEIGKDSIPTCPSGYTWDGTKCVKDPL